MEGVTYRDPAAVAGLHTVTNCDKPSAVPVESPGSSGYLWIILIVNIYKYIIIYYNINDNWLVVWNMTGL